MSFLPPIEKDTSRTDNRRVCAREVIGVVVLVYFGQHNWGKLLNISESGMAFEFDQLPPLGQPISFTLEMMGRPPAQLVREIPCNCIQAYGRVVWTQEFERAAGVQFVDLTTGTQTQIRQWLSIETSIKMFAEDKIREESLEAEPFGPRRTPTRTTSLLTHAPRGWGSALPESNADILSEPELETETEPQLGEELSLETLPAAFTEGGKVQHDSMEAESFAPPPTSPGTTSQVADAPQRCDSVLRGSNASRLSEVEPALEPEPEIEPEPQLNEEPRLETLRAAFAKGDKVQHDGMQAESFERTPRSLGMTSRLADGSQRWDSPVRESNAEALPESAPEPQLNKESPIENLSAAFAAGDKVQHEIMHAESVGPPPASPETTGRLTDGWRRSVSKHRESAPEELTVLLGPVLLQYPRHGEQKRKESSRLSARITRVAFIGASVFLVLLAVVASVRMIRARWSGVSAVTQYIRKPSANKGAPSGAGPRSATESKPSFQGETVDSNRMRRLLRFEDRAVGTAANRIANAPKGPATSANRRSHYEFKLANPKSVRDATNASTDDSALTEVPALPTAILTAASGKLLGGVPANAKPSSVVPVTPVGGQVQLSRPLSSVSPVYLPPSAPLTSENIASALGVVGSSDGVNGIKITKLMPNSPAATAGLAVGDIIMAIDGSVVNTEQSLGAELANRNAGSKVRVTFMHVAWITNATITIGSPSTSDYSFGFLFP